MGFELVAEMPIDSSKYFLIAKEREAVIRDPDLFATRCRGAVVGSCCERCIDSVKVEADGRR